MIHSPICTHPHRKTRKETAASPAITQDKCGIKDRCSHATLPGLADAKEGKDTYRHEPLFAQDQEIKKPHLGNGDEAVFNKLVFDMKTNMCLHPQQM